jgi:hypothetical protein
MTLWNAIEEATNNGITPEMFEATMKALITGDNETDHYEMDRMMCDLLTQLGYGAGVNVFLATDRWYA